jgi:hypothetical protein
MYYDLADTKLAVESLLYLMISHFTLLSTLHLGSDLSIQNAIIVTRNPGPQIVSITN